MKAFSNEIKSRIFSNLWLGYCLFWLCKWNTMHKIPGTNAVYWVTWFVESGMYRTAIKRQKNEKGNCSIWNKFYIKDVYWNKFKIKKEKCPVIYIASYFVNSLGIKNGKQLMKWNTRIIANWVLKLKIKMSRCCIILNNMLKNYLPVMMETSTGNLNPLDYKKSFYWPRAMRLMMLIKLVKLFVL